MNNDFEQVGFPGELQFEHLSRKQQKALGDQIIEFCAGEKKAGPNLNRSYGDGRDEQFMMTTDDVPGTGTLALFRGLDHPEPIYVVEMSEFLAKNHLTSCPCRVCKANV